MNETYQSNLSTASLPISGNVTDGSSVPLESVPVYQLSLLLWKIFPPIIVVLGTFGNVMSIVIMNRMTSGESTVNLFFIAIAVGDLLVLYTGQLKHWLGFTFDVHLVTHWPVLHYILFWMVMTSGVSVSWLLVCVTMQRALSIVWPHHVHRICTRRTVRCVIAGVVAFLVSLYSHFLYCIYVALVTNNGVQCLQSPSSDYAWFMDNVFSYVDLLLYSVLPFVLLVLGNGIMLWKLAASGKDFDKNSNAPGNSRQAIVRQKAINSVSMTVLAVSLTFIILTLPSSLYALLFMFKDQTSMSSQDTADGYLVYAVTILLSDTNSAVNFYLYCLTGRRFREEFVKIVCCRRTT